MALEEVLASCASPPIQVGLGLGLGLGDGEFW